MRWVRREPQTSAMNQLNVSLQHSIVTLSAQGWSARKVARELGLNRETVGCYLRLAADAAKPAILPIGSKSWRTSQCVPLREITQKGLEATLPGVDMVGDFGSGGGPPGSDGCRE